jgi:hypothetical protein
VLADFNVGAKSKLRAQMTERTSISETSVNFHQTTLRNNPEASHLHFNIILPDHKSKSLFSIW